MTLAEIYANEYLGRIFYFCLKKTGKEQDAAELASNINFEVIRSLQNGSVPEQFEQWVWTVVRNQWAKWARKQYFTAPEQVDIQDYEQKLASEENTSDELIRSEGLKTLRRELAFIREDYRQILVAHYFEKMSVSSISQKYHIPLGTVKTKLQTSRKILKEGMDMAREFGERSFNPETMNFMSSGYQPSGLPWSAIKRSIPVNILCAANNNPSTAEELSMELGIAVPYMTEEVNLLENAELLKKVGKDRYITNFFIAPRECLNETNELCCRYAENSAETIWKIAEAISKHIKENKALRSTLPEADETAYFAFFIEQCLGFDTVSEEIFTKFQRKDGGNWGFIGRETGDKCRLERVCFSNNCCIKHADLWNGYQCTEYRDGNPIFGNKIYASDVPDIKMLGLLKKVAVGEECASLSDGEKEDLRQLVADGFCKEADGKILIHALALTREEHNRIIDFARNLPEYQILLAETRDLVSKIRNAIAKYSIPELREDFNYYVAMTNISRHILAPLWKKKGLYTGNSCQFCALICE